jgi:hypothetical protein
LEKPVGYRAMDGSGDAILADGRHCDAAEHTESVSENRQLAGREIPASW